MDRIREYQMGSPVCLASKGTVHYTVYLLIAMHTYIPPQHLCNPHLPELPCDFPSRPPQSNTVQAVITQERLNMEINLKYYNIIAIAPALIWRVTRNNMQMPHGRTSVRRRYLKKDFGEGLPKPYGN
jgi:hypothetical protein